MSATYRARFILIGSMNPEEGALRSQIMDRFGLRIIVSGLTDPQERQEAYHRVSAYRHNPRGAIAQYAIETEQARQEIAAARALLPQVTIPDSIARTALSMISQLHIASLRAEITLFEAARACAAADNRTQVTIDDLRTVAPLALRLRQSTFINQYLDAQAVEEQQIHTIINTSLSPTED